MRLPIPDTCASNVPDSRLPEEGNSDQFKDAVLDALQLWNPSAQQKVWIKLKPRSHWRYVWHSRVETHLTTRRLYVHCWWFSKCGHYCTRYIELEEWQQLVVGRCVRMDQPKGLRRFEN